MIMDDVIENMRKNISVEVVQGAGGAGDVTGFRIAYSAADPKGAQRVTNEITSLFIEESLRSRTQQSLSTTAFFESQLDEARKISSSRRRGSVFISRDSWASCRSSSRPTCRF